MANTFPEEIAFVYGNHLLSLFLELLLNLTCFSYFSIIQNLQFIEIHYCTSGLCNCYSLITTWSTKEIITKH